MTLPPVFRLCIAKDGTTTIPPEMQTALELEEGGMLEVVFEPDGTIMLQLPSTDPIERLRQLLHNSFRGVDPVEYQRSIRDEDDE